MKVHIYTRVSIDKSAKDGEGLDDQKSNCIAWCIENGHKSFTVYRDEALSGTVSPFKRSSMMRLLSAIEPGDIVLADRIDRLNRDVFDFMMMSRSIKDAGGKLITVADGELFSSHESKLIDIVKAWAAESEAIKTRRNIKNALSRRRSEGRTYNGKPPFGFLNDCGVMKAHPVESKAALKYFSMKKSGHRISEIARKLNALGYTRRNGGEWTHKYVSRLAKNDDLYENQL